MAESDASNLTERQQYWFDHLRRCEASGSKLAAYAAEHDLSVASLYFHRRHFKQLRAGEPSRFVRAEVASATLPCRVHLRNGVVIELGVDARQFDGLFGSLSSLA
jgi:hypothetical protein